MMEALISIIIPIYKTEPYLRRCIDSVINQTYSNIEVILVDDGSPDGCPAICDEYAVADSRCKVIHQVNGGLSSARNAGIACAKGAYLVFVDSDDYLPSDAISIMVQTIVEANADMAFFGVLLDSVRGKVSRISYDKRTLMSGNEILSEYVHPNRNIPPLAWGKIYRTELFNTIKFPVGKIYEDAFVMHRILGQCSTVVYNPEIVYVQNLKNESITRSGFNQKKADLIDCEQELIAYIRLHRPELYDYVIYRKADAIAGTMKKIIQGFAYFKHQQMYQNLRKQLAPEYELAKVGATDRSMLKKDTFLAAEYHNLFVCKYLLAGITAWFKKRVKSVIVGR